MLAWKEPSKQPLPVQIHCVWVNSTQPRRDDPLSHAAASGVGVVGRNPSCLSDGGDGWTNGSIDQFDCVALEGREEKAWPKATGSSSKRRSAWNRSMSCGGAFIRSMGGKQKGVSLAHTHKQAAAHRLFSLLLFCPPAHNKPHTLPPLCMSPSGQADRPTQTLPPPSPLTLY